MRKKLLLLGLALAGVQGCQTTDAQQTTGSSTSAAAKGDPIAARRAGMRMSAAIVFGQLKPAATGTGELKGLAGAADALGAWGRAIPGVFPPGSESNGASRANPDLWNNKADFDAKALAFAAAADAAAAAARAEDRAAFAAQVGVLQQSCGGCHKPYRLEDK